MNIQVYMKLKNIKPSTQHSLFVLHILLQLKIRVTIPGIRGFVHPSAQAGNQWVRLRTNVITSALVVTDVYVNSATASVGSY